MKSAETSRQPGVFHIGEILTAITGTYICPTGMAGVYAVIEWVTGERHEAHQLGRAADELRAEFHRQLPWLAQVTIPPFQGKPAGLAVLDQLAAEYGEYHRLERLPFGAYVGREAFREAQERNALITPFQTALLDKHIRGAKP